MPESRFSDTGAKGTPLPPLANPKHVSPVYARAMQNEISPAEKQVELFFVNFELPAQGGGLFIEQRIRLPLDVFVSQAVEILRRTNFDPTTLGKSEPK